MDIVQRQYWVLFVMLGASACTSVPSAPERPSMPVLAPEFVSTDSTTLTAEPGAMNWWRAFDDPILGRLVEQALGENKDLAVAAANIETARALLGRQVLAQSFSTSSSADVEIGRAAREDADTELSGRGQIGATWEFDAFGRLSAATQSAMFQLEQLKEIRRDTAVIIAAETALAYVDYRGNQVRLAVAQSNADLQGESVELLRVLFENGRATRLDLERAEAQYRTTLASLPQLEINIRTAIIRLATLTGRTDMDLTDLLGEATDTAATIPGPPQTLEIDTPAALIRRRPDIRAAEAEIARRLALGDVERARLFPTLTFNANVLSLFTEDNVSSDSFGFGIGPAISWEGPDLRRVDADISIADAETRAAYAAYERTVVEAIGEVELALVSYVQEQARREDLESAANAAARAVELARLRFDEGLDDFLDVIDAQRTLLDAQDRLETNRLSTTRQAIATYRALGGIWQDEAFANATAEQE